MVRKIRLEIALLGKATVIWVMHEDVDADEDTNNLETSPPTISDPDTNDVHLHLTQPVYWEPVSTNVSALGILAITTAGD